MGEGSGDKDGISPLQALLGALGVSIGTGNIAGVATALVSGGPGAIFWMWIAALVGMLTKYAEVVLAVYYRQTDENGRHYGGPMYYIEKGLHCKPLAILFALFGCFACFGIWNMTQANSIATAMGDAFILVNETICRQLRSIRQLCRCLSHLPIT